MKNYNKSILNISSEDFIRIFNIISLIIFYIENENLSKDNSKLRQYFINTDYNDIKTLNSVYLNKFDEEINGENHIKFIFRLFYDKELYSNEIQVPINPTSRYCKKEITVNEIYKNSLHIVITENLDLNETLNSVSNIPLFKNDIRKNYIFIPDNFNELDVNQKVDFLARIFEDVMYNFYNDGNNEDGDIKFLSEIFANLLYNNDDVNIVVKEVINDLLNQSLLCQGTDYIRISESSANSLSIFLYQKLNEF